MKATHKDLCIAFVLGGIANVVSMCLYTWWVGQGRPWL